GILHLGSRWEDLAQVGSEVRSGGVAILLPLRQRLQARAFQLGRDIADELSRRLWLVLTHLSQNFLAVRTPKWNSSREHFVEHDAQAVDIGASIDAVSDAVGLLG